MVLLVCFCAIFYVYLWNLVWSWERERERDNLGLWRLFQFGAFSPPFSLEARRKPNSLGFVWYWVCLKEFLGSEDWFYSFLRDIWFLLISHKSFCWGFWSLSLHSFSAKSAKDSSILVLISASQRKLLSLSKVVYVKVSS